MDVLKQAVDEEERLVDLRKAGNKWKECAEHILGRSHMSCQNHWSEGLKPKYPDVVGRTYAKYWTVEEEEELGSYIRDGRDWRWSSHKLCARSIQA